MDSATLQKILSYAVKILFVVLGLLILISIVDLESKKKSPEEIEQYLANLQVERSGVVVKNENLPDPWPPKMNTIYPDMMLIDQDGVQFSLTDLKGRIIALEMVDMASPMSQAYAGAHEKGAYGGPGQQIDSYTASFTTSLSKFTGGSVTWPNENMVIVSLIIKNEKGEQPSLEDAQKWAAHFGMTKEVNHVVAISNKDLRDKATDKILPGFQLIDRDLLLRADSAGPEPKHNLSMTLIPLVPKLLSP